MTARIQLGALCAAGAAGLASVLLLASPASAVGIALAAVAAVLAFRSPAYPLALAPAIPLTLWLFGWEPLSSHQLAAVACAWIVLGVVVAVVRDERALPLGVVLSAPLVLALVLGVWVALRYGDGGTTLALFFAANVAPLVAGVAVGRRSADLARFAPLLLVAGGLAALVLWLGSTESVLAAQTLGLGLVAGVWLALRGASAGGRLAGWTAVPVLATALVVGGPRGSLAALVLGLVVVLALAPLRAATRILAPALFASAAGAAVVVAELVPHVSAGRVGSALAGPHSFDATLGVPGLVLLLGLFAASALPLIHARSSADASLAAGLFAFSVPFGLLAGRVGDPVAAWAVAGLALGIAQRAGAPLAEPILRIRPRRREAPVRAPAQRRAKPAPPTTRDWRELPGGPAFEILDARGTVLAVVRTRGLAEIARSAFAAEGIVTVLRPAETSPWDAVPAEIETAPPLAVPEEPPRGVRAELEDPGALLRRDVELSARVDGPADTVELEVAHAGRQDWRAVATAAAPFVLRLETATLEDGLYDLRVRALADGEAVAESAPVRVRRIDNTPPDVALAAPDAGTAIRGTVRLRADARDEGSGVVSVLFQFDRDGVWHPVVAEPAGAPEVDWDTTRVADGPTRVRAIAVDAARNSATSDAVHVTVENAVPVPAATVGVPTIYDLERLVAERPDPDPFVQAEREALVFHLRDYARVDGTIPDQFGAMIDDAFGL